MEKLILEADKPLSLQEYISINSMVNENASDVLKVEDDYLIFSIKYVDVVIPIKEMSAEFFKGKLKFEGTKIAEVLQQLMKINDNSIGDDVQDTKKIISLVPALLSEKKDEVKEILESGNYKEIDSKFTINNVQIWPPKCREELKKLGTSLYLTMDMSTTQYIKVTDPTSFAEALWRQNGVAVIYNTFADNFADAVSEDAEVVIPQDDKGSHIEFKDIVVEKIGKLQTKGFLKLILRTNIIYQIFVFMCRLINNYKGGKITDLKSFSKFIANNYKRQITTHFKNLGEIASKDTVELDTDTSAVDKIKTMKQLSNLAKSKSK